METVQLMVIMPGLHQPDPHSCRTYFDFVRKHWCKGPALRPQSRMELAVIFSVLMCWTSEERALSVRLGRIWESHGLLWVLQTMRLQWPCWKKSDHFLSQCVHTPLNEKQFPGEISGNPFFGKVIDFPDGGQWCVHGRRTRGCCEETPLGRRWSEAGNWAGCYLPHWLAFIFECLFPRHAASLGCVLPTMQRCGACCAQCPQSATPGWRCPLFFAMGHRGCLTSPEHATCFLSPDLLDRCFSVCLLLILFLCCKLSDPGNLCSSGPERSFPLPSPEFILSAA